MNLDRVIITHCEFLLKEDPSGKRCVKWLRRIIKSEERVDAYFFEAEGQAYSGPPEKKRKGQAKPKKA